MKENTRFFVKVIFAHVLTYTFCSMVFVYFFKPGSFFGPDTWRIYDYNNVGLGLAFVLQMIRGALYGIVFLFIKDTIYSKYGVIKLYVLIIIIGIFNIPEPVNNSISGFIKYIPSEPLNVIIGDTIPVLVQNLLFCIFVCIKWKDFFIKISNIRKND